MAALIEARSTTAGTPVKSCINTLAGRKLISLLIFPDFLHFENSKISSFVTDFPSSFLIRFSSRTFIENGKYDIFNNPCFSASLRLEIT